MSSYDDRPGSSRDPYRDQDDSGYSNTAVLARGDARNDTGHDERTDRLDGTDAYRAETDTVVERRPLGWNSGADFGLLLIRFVLGVVFVAHGGQKVFGWFGGPGLDGFADDLTEQGWTQTDVLAAVTGFTELVGGSLVVLGLFTPLAAAGLLGVMVSAIWTKWNAGLFAADGGFELELALGALAVGLVLAGPGRAALDNGRVWFRHPVVTGWLCLVIGVGAAIATRFLFLTQ